MKRKCQIMSICVILCLFVAGCLTVTVNQDPLIPIASNTGRLVMALAAVKAPEYVPEIERVRDMTISALQDNSIDLGPAIGNVMAAVQALSDHPRIGKYAGIITEASRLLMDVVRMEWTVPEKYARARRIVMAFLEGMKT